jgi:phage shock protein C
MFCSKCGNQVDPSSRFCPTCGATLSSSVPPPSGYPPNMGQLFRPITGRMIGGVCAGFALSYHWDLTVTRIITAVLIVCTGVGALAYIAAWIIIPEEPYPFPTKSV